MWQVVATYGTGKVTTIPNLRTRDSARRIKKRLETMAIKSGVPFDVRIGR